MSDNFSSLRIHVDGIVQGVGFRPFVYNLAVLYELTGFVRNTSSGVDIIINGEQQNLNLFIDELRNNPPVLSQIDSIQIQIEPLTIYHGFDILESRSSPGEFIPISPDMCICPECQMEMFDPLNRRYRYPFINCTNCGPRFTIIRDIPYDRPQTTMAGFKMCDACTAEYNDPADRRYHAQPTACPDCGPRVEFFAPGDSSLYSESAIQAARSAIIAGKILAVKGLGGYHLACDAFIEPSLDLLRERKQRSDKPFALMATNVDTIRKFVEVNDAEEISLRSPQHPIVLLKKKNGVNDLDLAAPDQTHLGFMLPYTPLHLLLLESAHDYPCVLVMTSGNLSEEPIAYQDLYARTHLSSLADCYLTHDRPIHMRIDDSVVRHIGNNHYPIRRARGFAPDPIRLQSTLKQVLACGAEQKNTFALSKKQYIFLSHHIGDLENLETLESYEEGIQHYRNLFRVTPDLVAVDLHPDYLSTRFGERIAQQNNLPLVRIQHHHAHLAACLADNNVVSADPVIGLIFDGTGYGTDGYVWGGEVLVGGYTGFERRFHLEETLLPGGDTAIRNPSKIALSHIYAAGLSWEADISPVNQFSTENLNVLNKQLVNKINCVPTTSMGRLFDAVASILGIRHSITYEGQAAIELESHVDRLESQYYRVPITGNEIKSLDLISQVMADSRAGVPVPIIAARFHNAIAQMCLACCEIIRSESSIHTVVLSGGVWQNTTLLIKTSALLRSAGFTVLMHQRVPANDGGIALGQIVIADAIQKL